MLESANRLKVRQEVYDTYWYFAAERQNIFWKRLHNDPQPYTTDPILAEYKFCNSYRILDRVSQYLVRNVIYNDTFSSTDTLLRIFLFRLLNKAETWTELEKRLGTIGLRNFSIRTYAEALEDIRKVMPIYGNAFILCANKAFGYAEKHKNQLALLDQVFNRTDTAEKLLHSHSLRELFMLLKSLPLIGNFMAYQIAIDFNYSAVFDFSESEFTVAGPGAERGIAKCFIDTGGLSNEEVIMYMVQNQEAEFARLGLQFQRIGKRPLQAIDCQGLFCETDKYCRVRFPQLASNRSRIKNHFTPQPSGIGTYFFPPKWHIELS